MLGIEDPAVWLAYVLCLLSTLLCVVYAWRNWNRGDDSVADSDVKWVAAEQKLEDEL